MATADRYELIENIKFEMLFGYKIIDNTSDFEDRVLYEYGEHQLGEATSKVNFLNIISKG